MHLSPAYQTTILVLFIVYQFSKLRYYYNSNKYDHRANEILHIVHLMFLGIVITGCLIELANLIANANSLVQVVEYIGFCIFQIFIYSIVELLTDLWYCYKLGKTKGNLNLHTSTFGNSLSRISNVFKKNNNSVQSNTEGNKDRPPKDKIRVSARTGNSHGQSNNVKRFISNHRTKRGKSRK